jgi:hypothetical protein
VIADSEFDDADLMARRAAGHRHIDGALGTLVDRREDCQMRQVPVRRSRIGCSLR